MTPPDATRLILLARDPAQASTCLHVDAGGRVLSRHPLDASHPLPADSAARTVVAVPGEAVRAVWLELPAHNPVQALAAARILLQDHVADAGELHIAVAAPTGSGPRLVAVTADTRMHDWRQRCQDLGVTADVLIADHLLLTAPADGSLQVVVREGRWLVRGPQLAFTAEPELARQIIGESPCVPVEDAHASEALLAGHAALPSVEQLDLLQHSHARTRNRVRSRRGRRAAVLAILCLLFPLGLLGAQTLRHALAAHSLEGRADALAAAHLQRPVTDDAAAALHAHHRQVAGPVILATQLTALAEAIERRPGTRIDSLDYAPESGVQAGLLHTSEADLEALRADLASAGIDLLPADSETVDGGLRTRLLLEQRP